MKTRMYTATVNPLAMNWWAIGLRGLIALLFGVLTFLQPGMTLLYLIYLFGFFAVFDGVLNLIAAFHARQGQDRWWGLLFVGLAGLLAGFLTFFYPGLTALTLLYFIATWAVVSGVFQIAAAIRLRKQIEGEWLLILGGALSVLFGVLLYAAPGTGALAFVLWIGAFAVVSGALLIGLAFRLRSSSRQGLSSGPQAVNPA